MGQIVSILWRRLAVGDSSQDLTTPLHQHQQKKLESHCINIVSDHPHLQLLISEDDANDNGGDDDHHASDKVITVVEQQVGKLATDDNDRENHEVANAAATSTTNHANDKVIIVVEQPVGKLAIDDDDRENHEVANVITITTTNNNNNYERVSEISTRGLIERRIGQYSSSQRILLVGEGDFSFSASLALAFGSATNLVATSLNSQDFLLKNYGEFWRNKMELESRGCLVVHGVNATQMVQHPVFLGSLLFDRIVFNFPHAGCFGKTASDLRAHQKLVKGFLKNAKKMIKLDGEIHITHKSNGFFLQWDIPKLASHHGLHVIQEIKFKRSKYPGYHTKYGFGGDKDFDSNPSKTYKFGIL